MRERYSKLADDNETYITFSTFHSFFYNILSKSVQNKKYSIINQNDKINILKKSFSINSVINEDFNLFNEVLKEFSKIKNDAVSITEYSPQFMDANKFRSIFKTYNNLLSERGLLDFDDILTECYTILKENPDILEFWQQRFKYILVDEFQDINPVQYEIMKLLASKYTNIFAVGDDDQSIYSFRGSKPELMFKFMNDFPNKNEFELSANFRSSESVVKSSSEFISSNRNRKAKSLFAVNDTDGFCIKKSLPGYEEEYDYITDEIMKIGSNAKIAILFRTNYVPIELKEKFRLRKIRFSVKEKTQCLGDSFIAKDLLAYMHLALGSYKRSDMYRIMNRPNRYINRNLIETDDFDFDEVIRNASGRKYLYDNLVMFKFFLGKISKLDLFEALIYIRKTVGYDGFLSELAMKEGFKLNYYKEKADKICNVALHYDNLPAFEKALMSDDCDYANQDSDANVNLLTMHSSKGLEYDYVFIPDVNEGNIPHISEKTKENMEEERRIMYVAMTRAKTGLYVTSVKNKHVTPSVFFREIKENK